MIISRGDANKEFYRRDVTPWDILHGKASAEFLPPHPPSQSVVPHMTTPTTLPTW
jgi:lipid-binding SYLF domain-containing protein